MSLSSDIALLVIGCALGWIANLALRILLARLANSSARFDELSAWVSEGADIATAYWLKESSNSDISLLAARIKGAEHRINLVFTEIEKTHWPVKDDAEALLDAYFDAMTGGNFEVLGREPDGERAAEV